MIANGLPGRKPDPVDLGMRIAIIGDVKQAPALAAGQPEIVEATRPGALRAQRDTERHNRLAGAGVEIGQIEHALRAPQRHQHVAETRLCFHALAVHVPVRGILDPDQGRGPQLIP